MRNVPTRRELVAALFVHRYGVNGSPDENAAVAADVDQLFSRKWLEGWYDATNGKNGLPDEGENPYGEVIG